MGSLIDIVFSNPVYLAIAVILTILLAYALIKKVIKLIFTTGVILVIYVIYLNYTGQEVPKNMDDLKESVSEKVEMVKDATAESINEAKESTRKVVEKKVEEKIDDLLGD
jgi:cell division protein FtsL